MTDGSVALMLYSHEKRLSPHGCIAFAARSGSVLFPTDTSIGRASAVLLMLSMLCLQEDRPDPPRSQARCAAQGISACRFSCLGLPSGHSHLQPSWPCSSPVHDCLFLNRCSSTDSFSWSLSCWSRGCVAFWLPSYS